MNAQNTTENSDNYQLQSFFIKPELNVKSGELSFNVINIINPTEDSVQIKPFLNKPEGWFVYSTFIKDTIIPPGDTLRLPFRIKTAVDATSDISHTITFEAYSKTNQLLTASSFSIQTKAIHDWTVNVPAERIFFYPRMNQAKFDVIVENKGNTQEAINLDYNFDNKISLQNADGSKIDKVIFLQPNSDTVLKLMANYAFIEDKLFDLSRIQINATTPDINMSRSLLIEKYKDTYNPLRIDETLPHSTELGIRFNSDNREPALFLNARGKKVFKNENTFSYNFSNYDLRSTNQFLENSFYYFLFTRNNLRVGLGSFSSTLGRNLYNQNGIMVANTIKVSKSGNLEVYGNQDFLKPISSVAVGYEYTKNKLKMHGSAAYNVNQYVKRNTASVILSSGTVPLFRDHTIRTTAYAFREDNYYGKKFYQMGFAWDINYFGWLGKQISFQLINNFGSPNIPGSTQGLLNNGIRVNYFLANVKEYISAEYYNTRRNYFYYSVTDTSAIRQPTIHLNNQYTAILYNNHRDNFFRWSAGPSAQLFKSEKPFNIQGDYETYQIQRVSLELNTIIGNNLTFDIKGGYRHIYFKQYQEISLNKFDLHLASGFQKNGYSISVNYHYGPLVNTGLYQSANDFDYNGIIINGGIFQSFFRKRVNVQLSANYMNRFDLGYANIQITPKIETYLGRNWFFVLKGNYGYFIQNTPEYSSSRSIYYTEASIVKEWGRSDYFAWQKKLRRLKVILYQDDNGNGIKDDFEKGIPYVKTRLKLTVGSDRTTSDHFPVDIALLSNEKGIVTFNQIPQGFYELEITPLTDVGEYFYVNKSNKEIDIITNTTIYIPFQKAAKIEGAVNVKRSKFIREGSPNIDLANIKVTAYNNSGNSYSSFTRNDGSFVIFVPGDTTYLVRMQNVFGNNFAMLQNDISVKVPDSANKKILFEFVELQRDIKFKSAEPVIPDSLKQRPQKVKILEGKIYENSKSDTLLRNDIPEFNLASRNGQEMQVGKFYVTLGETENLQEAIKIRKIFDENGLKAQIGTVPGNETFYVYSNKYSTRIEAQNEIDLLMKGGIKQAYILKYK